MKAIETENLGKVYTTLWKKEVEALKEFNLSVEEGAIYGLLGPNGAGKTTLIKILLGITNPTTGNAKLFNEPIANYEIRKRVGYLPENHKYPPFLTAKEVLTLFGELGGADKTKINGRLDFYLELVGLAKWKNVKVRKFSKGMMQRLGLAQAMISDPDIIFLDEPTDGVDPVGRREIRDIIKDLNEQGKTIFINSHLLSEVEIICNRVAILNHGKLVKEGSIEEITSTGKKYKITYFGHLDNNMITANENINSLVHLTNGELFLNTDEIGDVNRIIDFLRTNSVEIKEVVKVKNTLEDEFINVVKEGK